MSMKKLTTLLALLTLLVGMPLVMQVCQPTYNTRAPIPSRQSNSLHTPGLEATVRIHTDSLAALRVG